MIRIREGLISELVAGCIVGAITTIAIMISPKVSYDDGVDNWRYYIPENSRGRKFDELFMVEDPTTKVIHNILEEAKSSFSDISRENAARNIYELAKRSRYASSVNAAIDALEELAVCSMSSITRNKIRRYEQKLLFEED